MSFESLKELLDPSQIKTDPASLESFGKDWTHFPPPDPCAILFPKSTEEVQKIILWARSHKVNLVPSGGRTGLSGGAIAAHQEAVISLDKMNKEISFNATDRVLQVQAGMITEDLQNIAKEKNLFYPVDFAARGSSQIGGNVATNAGGIKVIKYGLTRSWVSSLTVVTGAGEILSLNNDLIKNASGYDLRHLMIGSEGTLGIITEVGIQLTSPPKELFAMLVGIQDLKAVLNVYSQFRTMDEITAFEIFTDKALMHVKKSTGLEAPFDTPVPYYLLIEIEKLHSGSYDEALKNLEITMENSWVIDGSISQNSTQLKDFWRLREDISEATSPYSPYKNDVSVRVSQVPAFLESIEKTMTDEYPNYEVVWFGHIGDGNLHINILKPDELSINDFQDSCKHVNEILFAIIQKLGGSISAEHGVGLTKKAYLHFTRSKEEIDIMKSIKKSFDPDSILNPGKVF